MRTKLKPPTDYSGNDPIRYYLYDIAISLRLLTAQKESLPSAPETVTHMYTDKGCTCQACTPGGAAYLKTYNFGSKYFRVPSDGAKGEWYLHEDGRYYWRPDESTQEDSSV